MTSRLFLSFLALAFLLLTAPFASAEPTKPIPDEHEETISVDEIRRGMRGHGYSVFAGTEPERFELEVIGVVRQQTPALTYILAKLEGQDLERSGVIGGMSGSPIYVEGRLAGALAYSYNFSMDPIAGITPIAAMRKIDSLRLGSDASETVPRQTQANTNLVVPDSMRVSFEDLVERQFNADQLNATLAYLRPRAAANGARATVQWSAGGFGESTLDRLRTAFGDVATAASTRSWASSLGAAGSGGTVSAGTVTSKIKPEDLRPGGSIAAVMVRGDLQLAAHGTISDRNGDEILAFAHPVFDRGPTHLPMATSEVITVIPNHANSFKLANTGDIVGTFDLDREAGARGVLGIEPRLIPISIRLQGLTDAEYQMEVVDDRFLFTAMTAVSAMGALESGSYLYGSQGLDMKARFDLGDQGELVLDQSFDSQMGAMDSILYLFNFSSFLRLNEMVDVSIQGLEIEYSQTERPREATLVAAHADRTEVEPGEKVQLVLEFQAYQGERYRQTIETVVPEQAPDGRYILLVGDGTSMDAARLNLEKTAPQTFPQALAYMNSLSSQRELQVLGLVAGRGLVVGGEALPHLPGSMRAILSGPRATALAYGVAHLQSELQERPIAGLERVDLTVRRR